MNELTKALILFSALASSIITYLAYDTMKTVDFEPKTRKPIMWVFVTGLLISCLLWTLLYYL